MKFIRFLKIDFDGNRIYGLDILRALAISFVVLGHGGYLLPDKLAAFQRCFIFDGVSLFFVLSGFLIGGILIKLLKNENLTLRKVFFDFWMRRWLRTLPAYFFVLVLLASLSFLLIDDFKLREVERYFFFMQNFNQPHPKFFPEAWSLSVEEWFYVLIPVIIFTLMRVFRFTVNRSIVVTVSFIILSTISFRLFRYSTLPISTSDEWDLLFKKQVITRLDSLMFGVLGAYASHYHKLFWSKKKTFFFITGILILLLQQVFRALNLFGLGLYSCVFSFVTNAIGGLFLLPLLSEWKVGSGVIYKVVTYISLTSYSIYLLHYAFVQGILLANIDFDVLSKFNLALLSRYLLYWIFTAVGAIILYKYVEKPFIDLRDKIKDPLRNITDERPSDGGKVKVDLRKMEEMV